ncbi:hypothetical protein BKH46_01430 [Helicobacter sp. 12S02634-8]|uniref:LLM class flavin-dependent oxidoreductase n=1 Tax=Helicobacter sp. 12S02634-8 TaxID=1476199 RepID=UPI000BA5D82E|nr:LLM class flavin-dependent oxidoreductase [Helicobacter sp. 12S02634-8]PAF48001.1 hypothetical protein BKH46_01430 [Helicobacter sp. 12S02634-8]
MTLQNIPFSFLDLVTIRANDGITTAFQNSLSIAKKAQELGFLRFWFAEHHNMDGIASSATAILIAHIAAHTQKIRVGSGGVMLPNHTPLVVAEQFGTLQSLYGDRIDLGVGRARGGDYESALAVRKERIHSDENFFAELEELEDFLGDGTRSKVRAVPGWGTRVPIYLLGSSLYSAQVAARKGLPYAFASHFAPKDLLEVLRLYREHFTPSLACPKPYAIVALPCVLADTKEEALFLSSSAYQRGLALLRGESLKLKTPIPFLDISWNQREKAAVMGMQSMMVLGNAEDAKKQLITILQDTQADELIFTCDIYDQTKRIRSLEILDSLRH